ncbi:MAG: methyl-accepting chemotaxis protein, partial [Treponema sp.]|nr:methyl-accepting chemotaxis protein [Treponema sp.]
LAERAVLFSTPGGLLDTAERFIPGIRRNTRKIEGVPGIYHYLEDVYSMLNKPDTDLPLLVDCLNCEKGCNGGPGTGNNKKPVDELESPVRRRSAELEKQLNPKQKENLYNKYHRLLDKYWKPGLYDREYKNKSQNYTIKQPTEAQLTEVFKRMRKFSDADIYDCTSCGYGSCKGMAVAIFNKLNKPENCAHNNLSLLEEEKQAISAINQKLSTHIGHALGLIEIINNAVNDLSGRVSSQTTALDKSTNLTEEMVSSLRSTTSLSIQKREAIARLIENASRGQSSMQETIQSVQEISHSVDDIAAAIKIISGIAANTNLLAMNAAIEAAHAGEAGKGFAVVADEIRHLSETTSANSRNISKTLSNIIQGINITSRRSDETNSAITEMSGEIRGFADTMTSLINTFSELSGESESISAALGTLREMYGSVKSGYSDMLSMTGRLTDNMNDLAQIAGER